eukprot:6430363-Karenia_brevis.AAC.1
MKEAAHYFPDYPEWLQHLRCLCKFFRNDHYRAHLMKVLRGRCDGLDLDKLLKWFTAGFAKWRYETLVEVLRQLGDLRSLCEEHIVRPLFNSVEDEGELQGVLNA